MDPLIENLKSTTFFGKRLTRKQIASIQETARLCPGLSRTELGHTICEHLRWRTPNGDNRVRAALRLLAELERLGILTLPAKQGPGRGRQKPLVLDRRSAPQPAIEEPLDRLAPLQLKLASAPEEVAEWNQWVKRYHPLGYKRLPGAQLRYFAHSADGFPLALLGFGAAAWKTKPRDEFIGWDHPTRQRNLPLLVNNARYLILPWAHLPHLASHLLAQLTRRLPLDWQRRYCLRPVLLETFCESERFRGTCYRAANWIHVGQTQGRGKLDTRNQFALPVKDILLKPIHPHWRSILNS